LKKIVDLIQNGMSSVSGTSGELSHLTPSLSREVEASFCLLDLVEEGIDELATLVENGWILERVNSARFSFVPSCRETEFILKRPSITNLEFT
tara:strand:- start:1 stop:279 length:279 start_codon:yes stop_codon:yes gene_type:complete